MENNYSPETNSIQYFDKIPHKINQYVFNFILNKEGLSLDKEIKLYFNYGTQKICLINFSWLFTNPTYSKIPKFYFIYDDSTK